MRFSFLLFRMPIRLPRLHDAFSSSFLPCRLPLNTPRGSARLRAAAEVNCRPFINKQMKQKLLFRRLFFFFAFACFFTCSATARTCHAAFFSSPLRLPSSFSAVVKQVAMLRSPRLVAAASRNAFLLFAIILPSFFFAS